MSEEAKASQSKVTLMDHADDGYWKEWAKRVQEENQKFSGLNPYGSYGQKTSNPNEWEDRNTVSKCPLCERNFGIALWKRHCRACGKVVCDNCSKHRILLRNQVNESRVCEKCHTSIRETGEVPEAVFRDELQVTSRLFESMMAEKKTKLDRQNEARRWSMKKKELLQEGPWEDPSDVKRWLEDLTERNPSIFEIPSLEWQEEREYSGREFYHHRWSRPQREAFDAAVLVYRETQPEYDQNKVDADWAKRLSYAAEHPSMFKHSGKEEDLSMIKEDD